MLSGGDSAPFLGAKAEYWINIINEFQRGALATRLRIPMFFGIDAVHGNGIVYNTTIFPHNIGLGAARQVPITPFSLFAFPYYEKDTSLHENGVSS